MLTSQANEGEVTLELSLAFQSVHQRHNGISETTNDCSGGMIEVPLVLLSSGSLGSSSEPWDQRVWVDYILVLYSANSSHYIVLLRLLYYIVVLVLGTTHRHLYVISPPERTK